MNTRSLAGCSLPQPAPAPAGACGAEVWEQLEALGRPSEAVSRAGAMAAAAGREELLPWGNSSPDSQQS